MADPLTGTNTPGPERQAPRQGFYRERFQPEWDYLGRLLITLVVIGLAYFLWRISSILLLIFAAVLLAVLLRSFANLIEQRTQVPVISPH